MFTTRCNKTYSPLSGVKTLSAGKVLIKLREILKENYTVQNICRKRNINNYALVTGREVKVA